MAGINQPTETTRRDVITGAAATNFDDSKIYARIVNNTTAADIGGKGRIKIQKYFAVNQSLFLEHIKLKSYAIVYSLTKCWISARKMFAKFRVRVSGLDPFADAAEFLYRHFYFSEPILGFCTRCVH